VINALNTTHRQPGIQGCRGARFRMGPASLAPETTATIPRRDYRAAPRHHRNHAPVRAQRTHAAAPGSSRPVFPPTDKASNSPTDHTGQRTFSVGDLILRHAAEDLGLASPPAAGTITSAPLLGGLKSSLFET